jgi:hypothetical protein
MAGRVSGRRSAEKVLDQIKGKPVIGPLRALHTEMPTAVAAAANPPNAPMYSTQWGSSTPK